MFVQILKPQSTTRKQSINFSGLIPLMCAFLQVLFCVPAFADIVIPSNRKLVSALSDGAESVGIVRFENFNSTYVVGREFIRPQTRGVIQIQDNEPAGQWLQMKISREGKAIEATSVRTRDYSEGIDAAKIDIVSVIIADHSIRKLEDELSTRPTIRPIAHPLIPLYKETLSRIGQNGEVFEEDGQTIAFLEDNIVILAINEEVAVRIADRLLSEDITVSSGWSDLIPTMEIDSPVLILRALTIPNFPESTSILGNDIEDFLVGMWIPDVERAIFQLSLISRLDLQETKEYFERVAILSTLAGDDAYNLEIRRDNAVYVGELEVKEVEPGEHYTDMWFTWLLGILFYI